ncbi:MAG: hypothetical protein OEM67_09820 [Thermoleophilia bacterium]|nr:hypothetical protein [Thermoleophilia bacterium]MDH3725883.1 hypothetical protein [Thermoleophilia bacterium]
MRILVVANETLAGDAVMEEVAYRARGHEAEVLVIAPALQKSRLERFTGGSDATARANAENRLRESINALNRAGFRAEGRLGDSNPLQATLDAVRDFLPAEVVISTHPAARSNWLERRVVQRAREKLDIPVHHIVVDLEHEIATVDADARGARAPRPERLRLFHFADYDTAMRIRESGFLDEEDDSEGGAGVWMIDSTVGSRGDDRIAFSVTASLAEVAPYERSPGFHEERRFFLPAALVNRLGPVVAVDDDTAE